MARNAGSAAAPPRRKAQQPRGGRPAQLSRERILDVARQIPARELSMPVVARHLGVSATALYRHFESRDSLFVALGAQLAQKFDLRPPDPAGWREWLIDTGVALFRFLDDNPAILVAPSWAHIAGMGQRMLESAHATLEGAGFDAETSAEIWGVVSGQAYLGARLLNDARAPIDPAALRVVKEAWQRDTEAGIPGWLAVAEARANTDPHQLLARSLRWLVHNLPAPGQGEEF